MNVSMLEEQLAYRFRQPALLHQALTHRSYGATNNERLEFLGDSLLNCVIAADLFTRFPALPEGDLSRLRANLVRQDGLLHIAQTLGLGDLLHLGEGEAKSGGRSRPSMLADAVEALIGAVYLESGFATAQALILRLYQDQLSALRPDKPQKDAKTRLQEWLQARRHPLPRYTLLNTQGAAHEQLFAVSCTLTQPVLVTTGEGASRRMAEQAAADLALKALNA